MKLTDFHKQVVEQTAERVRKLILRDNAVQDLVGEYESGEDEDAWAEREYKIMSQILKAAMSE